MANKSDKGELPTRLDICPSDGNQPDEATALNSFLGKTRAEMAEIFAQDEASLYIDDLLWMGKKAYLYYLGAVQIYLESEESAGDSDSIFSLISTIERRAERFPDEFLEGRDIMRQIITRCHNYFAHFFDDGEFEQDARERIFQLIVVLKSYLEALETDPDCGSYRQFVMMLLRLGPPLQKNLPTLEEISPSNGENPFEYEAAKTLYGGTREVAERFFFNPMLYMGDSFFLEIGPKAFAYYFPALKSFLFSNKSEGNENLVATIRDVVKYRVGFDPDSLVACRDEVLEMLEYIENNYEKFQSTRETFLRNAFGEESFADDEDDEMFDLANQLIESMADDMDGLLNQARREYMADRPQIGELIGQVKALPA